jgi:hypothetical protein
MTLTLEFPPELESQIKAAARQRGTDAQTVIVDSVRAGIGAATGTGGSRSGAAVSPLRAAIEKIKATPIRSLGPLDAAADLEEARAGQDR